MVVLAAGWQQDEGEEEVLRRHLGPEASVLPLYGWFEVVMREVPDLRAAYRARQDALIRLRALHRIRLSGALQVVRELLTDAEDPAGQHALTLAKAHVRELDAELMQACADIHAEHGRPWREEPIVQRLQERAREILEGARAIVLTGGNVAVLQNRMDFFDVGSAIVARRASGTPVIAWSAGAMVLTEKIVLFYDDPPEGEPQFPEILEGGFGLVRELVLLPHARQRLRLDDASRVGILADRFAPATCLGLENGAWLDWEASAERWVNRGPASTASHLEPDGAVVPLPVVEAS